MVRVDIADTVEGGDPEGGPQAAQPPVAAEAEAAAPAVAEPEAPAAPVEVVEAASDEEAEGVDWVRTGWVRMRVRGTDGKVGTYRLRAPLLREMKRLRLALENAEDEVEVRRQALLRAALDTSSAMTAANDLAEPERTEVMARLAREDRQRGQVFTEFAEDTRIAWLDQVFASPLAVDGAPDDFPAYVVGPEFCAQLLAHWRTVPLAPGR